MKVPFYTSKAERQRQRDQEVRRGVMHTRRYIKTLEKNVKEFREKAVEARRIGADDQLKSITHLIKRSLLQMRMQERQLLSIETALQLKNQAESMKQFASSMQAVSASIGEAFGSTNLNKTMQQYEQAMQQADDMNMAMDLFLETTGEMVDAEPTDNSLVSDSEIQHMLDEDFQKESLSAGLTKSLDDALQLHGARS